MQTPKTLRISLALVLPLFMFFMSASHSFAATFTAPMGVGSSGAEVSSLQQVLITDLDLSIPTPTGYYGTLTEGGVMKYQTAHGISDTGYVGPLTLASLNSTSGNAALIATLTAQLQALEAELAQLLGSTTPPISGGGGGGGGGGGNNTCAPGETGTYPNCVPEGGGGGSPPETCADLGETGTYPNCVPNQGDNGLTTVVPGVSGVLLGIHVDPSYGEASSEEEVATFEQSIGRNLAIDSEYYNWSGLGDSDNTGRVQWDIANGLLPMESWRPLLTKNKDKEKDTCATANAILGGQYDAQIKQQADTLKSYGVPILLRWNYEMTDNEYNYCFNNGAKVDSQDYSTAGPLYVAVWKHIHDIFTNEGATNVAWVWAPAASLFSQGGNGQVDTTDWQYFYPGSSYVDWIANDHYNKTFTPESYGTDTDIKNFYTEVSGLGKPLMQSETGAYFDPTQNPDPQTEWLSTMFTAMQTEYPDFRAMVYWDGDSGGNNNGGNQDIDNDPDDNSDISLTGSGKTGGTGGSNFGISSSTNNGSGKNTTYHISGEGLATYKTFSEEAPFNVVAQLSN